MSSTDAPPRRTSRAAALATVVAAVVVAPLLVLVPAEAKVPQVTWSDRSVVVGKKVTATVDPDSLPGGAEVVLQRKFPDKWRVADNRAKSTKKGLVLKAPSDQFGGFVFRVAAIKSGEVVETSDNTSVTVRPSYKPAGSKGSYSFLSKPRWRWDSCGKISWQFNSANSPRKGLSQIKGSLRRIHQATGLEFRYAGKTKQKANVSGAGIKGSAIIIGWQKAKAFKKTTGARGAIGVGGARYVAGYKEADGTKVSKATTGGVVLNAKYNGKVRSGFGKGITWGDVIMHEFGHVLGLGHTGSEKQLMYGTVTTRPARWGAGDLTGLRKVGDTGGCLIKTKARVGPPQTTSAR